MRPGVCRVVIGIERIMRAVTAPVRPNDSATAIAGMQIASAIASWMPFNVRNSLPCRRGGPTHHPKTESTVGEGAGDEDRRRSDCDDSEIVRRQETRDHEGREETDDEVRDARRRQIEDTGERASTDLLPGKSVDVIADNSVIVVGVTRGSR